MHLVQNFFQEVLDAVHTGDRRRGQRLLGYLREPNETHLGLSRGHSRGYGLGTEHHSIGNSCRSSDEIYLDSDVRPFELRMLEAGYDVLFNKTKWRSKSPDRRAPGGSKGINAGMYLTQGQAAEIKLHVFDGFMAYPMITAGPFIQALPRAAWLMGSDGGGRLEILGDWKAGAFPPEDTQDVIQGS